MAITVTAGAFDPDIDNGGALDFVVTGTGTDASAARTGLEAAKMQVFEIPHRDEPEDPLLSFGSDVADPPDGAQVWFDIGDYAEDPAFMAQVVEAVVRGLTSTGVTDAILTNKRVLGEL
jgi:hypothetical protein